MANKCDQCSYTAAFRCMIRRHQTWVHSDQRPWECSFSDCRFRTKSEQILIEHKRKHETSVELRLPYSCAVVNCNYRAGVKSSLDRHIWAKHTSGRTRDVPCPICPMKFYMESSLQEPIQTHTKEKRYSCDQCKFTSHSYGSLTYHKKTVHDKVRVRTHKCTFTGCSFSFSSSSYLKTHLQTHSADPSIRRPHPCDFTDCTYRASTKAGLRSHVHAHHDPKRTREHDCPLCRKSFYTKANVKAHINKIHTNEKAHKCSACPYATQSPTYIQQHFQRVHAGQAPEKKLKCDSCDYRSSDSCELRLHKMTIHSDVRRFKCTNEDCNYKTNYPPALRRHLRTHEDNPEKRYPFACSFPGCDFRRRATDEIKCHEQKHQNSKLELKCKLCPTRSYPDKNSLNFHERVAHIRRSYQCSVCSYAGLTRLNLEEHARECHRDQISSGDHKDGAETATRRWKRKHKSAAVVAESKQVWDRSVNICSHCSFEGHDRESILQHSIVHRVPLVLLQTLRLQIM